MNNEGTGLKEVQVSISDYVDHRGHVFAPRLTSIYGSVEGKVLGTSTTKRETRVHLSNLHLIFNFCALEKSPPYYCRPGSYNRTILER